MVLIHLDYIRDEQYSPKPLGDIHVHLLEDVENSPQLQSTVSLDSAGLCCLIDADMLFSFRQLQLAIQLAVLNLERQQLKSANVYQEILYQLSAARNIQRSFQSFGVSTSTTNIVLVFVGESPGHIEETMGSVKGRKVEEALFTEGNWFQTHANLDKIRKEYKLSVETDVEEDEILSRMSTKEWVKK